MKEAKAYGRANAPYLFVMVSEPSEGMFAWFWRQLHVAGIMKTDCRVVFLIDEPPAGAGGKPLVSQVRSARARFERDVKRSSPKVVCPMGREPFFALTGINEGIFDVRGYLIRRHLFHPVPTPVWEQIGTYVNASKATGAQKGDPKMKWVTKALPTILGDFRGVVIPMFTLEHIRTEGFAVAPAFIEDVRRAKRAHDGKLHEVGKKFTYISTLEELPEPEAFGDLIAIDIETHGIDNEVIDLVSFSDGKLTAAIDWTEGARVYVERLFALPGRLFAVHNSPFDLPRLKANGVRIPRKVLETQVFDTMFGFVQVQPDLHKALGRVASVLLDLEPWKTSSRKEGSHFRTMVKKDPRGYSAKDSFYTYYVARVLIAVMKDLGAWNYFMGQGGHPGPGVMATIPELARMTRGGIRTNREYAAYWCPKLEKRQLRYLKLWRRMFPAVQFSSNKQLAKLLYKKWGLPVQRNKDDGVSVDELALVKLQAHVRDNQQNALLPGRWQTDSRATPRVFDLMLRLRFISKLISTYMQPVLLTDRSWVHPSYMPVSKDDEKGGKKMDSKGNTSTGRLASYDPNIQNQLKKIPAWAKRWCPSVRNLYVPDDDTMCFVQADYKSAELFIQAGASGDRRLMEDLLSGDMHGRNAARHGISRDTGKNVTYASQYLASPAKQSEMILEQEHKYVSPPECQQIAQAIWGYYTDASAYKDQLIELCNTKGHITNHFGRIRFFHSGRAPAAVDFIPQSDVADILWCVLKPVAVMARKLGGRLVTTVHDSILICVPSEHRDLAARRMKKIMERKFDCIAKDFFIPVDVEVGEPGAAWGMLKKVTIT